MYTAQSFRRHACFFCLFLFVTTFSTAQSRAGCPEDIHPVSGHPNYVAWNTDTLEYSVAVGCVVKVIICKRFVLGQWQYWIDEFWPSSVWSSGCNNLTWSEVYGSIREQIFIDPNILPGPCDQPRLIVTVFAAQCMSFHVVSGVPVCKPCTGAYCAKSCEVCIGPTSERVVERCGMMIIGSAECYDFPEDLNEITFSDIGSEFPGTYYVCYTYDCDIE